MFPQKTKKPKSSNYQNNLAKENDNTGHQKNVLILPPVLLQKLGINLENIQSSKGCTSNTKIGDSSKLKCSDAVARTERREEIVEKIDLPNESSILETANLMKASVFLSPTFADTKPILDEEINNSEMSVEDSSPKPIKIIKTDNPIKHYYADEANYDEKRKGFEIDTYCQHKLENVIDGEEPVKFVIKQNENIENISINNVLESKNKVSSLPGEAQGSENSDDGEKPVNFVIKKNENIENISINNVLESKNKVSSLPGEAQGSENSDGLKILSSLDKNDTIPATMDLIISINNNTINKNISPLSNVDRILHDYNREEDLNEGNAVEAVTFFDNFDKERNNRIDELQETKLHIENNIESNSSQRVILGVDEQLLLEVPNNKNQNDIDTSVIENSRITVNNETNLLFPNEQDVTLSNKNNVNDNEESYINKHVKCNDNGSENCQITKYINAEADKQDDLNLSPELLQSMNNTDTESKISLDKVEEIALYLGQHFYAEHNRNCNIDKIKKNSQHKRNSKLSIQGVEKPGGNIKITHENNTLKTYSKGKRTISSNIAAIAFQTGYIKDIAIDYNIDDKYLLPINYRNFCLCEDFGSFSYYHSDENYEHIHFWEQKHVQCSVEVLLSVYQDNNFEHSFLQEQTININVTQDTENENQFEISDDTVFDICWSHRLNNPTTRNVIEKYEIQECYQEIQNYKKSVHGENSNCAEIDAKLNKGKRKRIDNASDNESDHEKKGTKKTFEPDVTCAACNKEVSKHDWDNHISKGHCFIDWKNGEEIYGKETNTEKSAKIVINASALNDVKENLPESATDHVTHLDGNLKEKAKERGLDAIIAVPQIETEEKQISKEHVSKTAVEIGDTEVNDAIVLEDTDRKYVTCAVCSEVLLDSLWLDHITRKHNYIAWKDGDVPLDCSDEDNIRDYLNNIIKEIGELVCAGCGLKRKFAKIYLKHIKNCQSLNGELTKTSVVTPVKDLELKNELVHSMKNQITDIQEARKCKLQEMTDKNVLETEIQQKQVVGLLENEVDTGKKDAEKIDTKDKHVTCAVCKKQLLANVWMEHVSRRHNYIAWKHGDMPLDTSDENMVRDYLNNVIKEIGELVCKTCGLKRKFAKSFLKHIRKCQSMKRKRKDNSSDSESDYDQPLVKKTYESPVACGVCKKKVPIYDWNNHISQEHCFIAWRNGQKIDFNSNDLMRNLRKVLRDNNKLICTFCKFEKYDVNEFIKHVRKCKRKFFEEKDSDEHTEVVIDIPAVNVESEQVRIQTVEEGLLESEGDRRAEQGGDKIVLEVDTEDGYVTCAICRKFVLESLWVKHISRKHNYIGWRDGEEPLDCMDDEMMIDHYNYVIREIGGIICKNCGLKRKFAKSYLKHIKNCQNNEESDEESILKTPTRVIVKREKVKIEDVNIKCGVCQLELKSSQWIGHITEEHEYLAWKEGDPPLDLNDSKQVYDHLVAVAKKNDGLICKNCGGCRKYVKAYMKHKEICNDETATVDNSTLNESQDDTVDAIVEDLSDDEDANVTCGVCKMDVEGKNWLNHIRMHHGYLAWKEGKPPLNLDDTEEIQKHLYFICKKYNGLICNKCGLLRKYVKVYLSHIESCDSNFLDSSMIGSISNKDLYECGVCAEAVDARDWTSHAMKNHYNIAWAVGEYPIDLKNPSVVEKCLKEYKQLFGKLKCKICDTTRVSVMGFYAHIIQCGKTEEEIDQYKIFCEICNSSYLCIYKNQHAAMHREQEFSREIETAMKEQQKQTLDSVKIEQLSERRRAAEKAREFIAKAETFAHICSKCGFGSDDQTEFEEHICSKIKDISASEDSDIQQSSSDESVDTIVESILSEHEEDDWRDQRRKKKYSDNSSAATRVPRVPFTVDSPKTYLNESAADYRNTYLTNEVLFSQWQNCRMELVLDEEISNYLPTVKESCKVTFGRGDYQTFTQFEAKKNAGLSIFVGGCIQCISWAPPHVDDEDDSFGHYLAVACNNNYDSNRFDSDKTYQHSGLLQIWDFGDLFSTTPKFALGIAHEYGTIWAIDWCPSGARNMMYCSEMEEESSTDNFIRLGLLAVACSNGSAYIFSVPYPSSLQTRDKIVYKFTPVAELKSSRGERQVFQATSISWSKQNKYETIVVGYSDGTIACYNLDCDCPLLMDRESGVDIFYPYHDERPHNSCIEDVQTFPSSEGAGIVSSASPTGSVQRHVSASVYGHLSSTSSAFVPHWPALMLAGNEAIVNQAVNELDWWGLGRRTGSVQTCCGCWQCGNMAMYTPPVLRIMKTHPVYSEFYKESIAVIQMRQISQKRTKHKNDDLQLKLEPLTYNDTVKVYALEFKTTKELNKEAYRQINKPKEPYPERFPLSNVSSMAFYPSPNHHKKLAVATHADCELKWNYVTRDIPAGRGINTCSLVTGRLVHALGYVTEELI